MYFLHARTIFIAKFFRNRKTSFVSTCIVKPQSQHINCDIRCLLRDQNSRINRWFCKSEYIIFPAIIFLSIVANIGGVYQRSKLRLSCFPYRSSNFSYLRDNGDHNNDSSSFLFSGHLDDPRSKNLEGNQNRKA